jgi:hypothetical protein
MRQFQIRYSDDEQPIIWMCVAKYYIGGAGLPVSKGGKPAFAVGAGSDPLTAMMKLLDEVVDGAECAHCHKPTGVTDHWTSTMPMATAICWWQYDPETKTFRRGCEGDQ